MQWEVNGWCGSDGFISTSFTMILVQGTVLLQLKLIVAFVQVDVPWSWEYVTWLTSTADVWCKRWMKISGEHAKNEDWMNILESGSSCLLHSHISCEGNNTGQW